ncbi:hypothetical protein GTN66_01830 [bacterium]|nr:hypothetical protein [bacterium]NIO73145.1 hypothetical protein [bacterium]
MKKSTFLIVAGILLITLLLYGCTTKKHGQEMKPVAERESVMGEYAEEVELKERENRVSELDEEYSGKKLNGVREIKIEARQFAFNPAKILVKKGERVRLISKSLDVTHGLGIEAYNINQKLPPGEEKVIEFTADKSGKFHFHCSVYCGAGHGKMHGTLIVKE